MLTTFDADEHVLRALRAGAAGFLLKDTAPAEIVAAVCRVAQGQPVLSPTVTRRLMTRVAGWDGDQRRARARDRLTLLTDREREIALPVGEGRPNAEIGGQLYLSVPTRQDAHLAHPHQAGPEQPGADRPVGPRRRPAARRGLNTQR
jgi:DNA-binding NarL/FixJ family response regulator